MNRNEGRTRWWAGLALLPFLAIAPLTATEPEDELKSATVLTFIRHSEWRKDTAGPISVAVLGRPAMARTLRRSLEGRTASNRPIHIVDANASADLNACHVVYIASDNSKEVLQILAGLRASHALTIGESGRFLEFGGAVNLLIVDGHMSFEVSRDAIEHAGVTISSTLLRYGQVSSSASRQGRPPL